MGRYILGLHAGHNSSAVIGDRSGLLFAIQEERLTGEKNYWGFPKNAINACLEAVGAGPKDLINVAYGGSQVISRYHSRDDILNSYRRQDTVLGRLRQRIAMPLVLAIQPNLGQRSLRDDLASVGLSEIPLV